MSEVVHVAFVPSDDGAWIAAVVDALGLRAELVHDPADAHIVGGVHAARAALQTEVRSLTLLAPEPDPVWERASSIEVPTLVVGRPGDPSRPFALALELVGQIAGCRRIDDDPEQPPLWERSLQLAGVLMSFVASVERAAGR